MIDPLGPVRRLIVGVCACGIFVMVAVYALSKFILCLAGIAVAVVLVRLWVRT